MSTQTAVELQERKEGGLQGFQRQFGRRIRDPRGAPLPAGVPRRSMGAYEELLFNNLLSFLDPCFPVARACLGQVRWQRLCRAFFREWPCQTSWFREIPREFVDYLETACEQPLPPWFAELARYEWAELAVDVLPVETPRDVPQASLLEAFPVVNPALLVLSFAWPVHRIGPAYRPRKPRPTHLLVYRQSVGERETVGFAQVSPAAAALVVLLQQEPLRGREALARLAGLPEADTRLLEFGRQCLEELRQLGVILGARS